MIFPSLTMFMHSDPYTQKSPEFFLKKKSFLNSNLRDHCLSLTYFSNSNFVPHYFPKWSPIFDRV